MTRSRDQTADTEPSPMGSDPDGAADTLAHAATLADAASTGQSAPSGEAAPSGESAPSPEAGDNHADGDLFAAGSTRRYTDARRIGAGGIGQVLAVRDARLGREVAYKELQPVVARAKEAIARFGREAWVTAQLEHPAIVPVYDAGRRRDGAVYYTMRYVRGHSLGSAIKSCDGLAERLELLGHMADVCQALAYAHARGVVHRDLKPDNVMVGSFGETQVVDWGLAQVSGTADEEAPHGVAAPYASDAGMTVAGTVMGTPAYMSCEQARGDKVDARADVWSLGVMLYELLTGRRPFAGEDTPSLLDAVQRGDYPAVRSIEPEAPAELAAVVDRALAPLDERYESAEKLHQELDAYMAGRRVDAYHYSTRELLSRLVQRHRAPLIVGACMLVITIGLALDFTRRLQNERDRLVVAEAQATAASKKATANLNLALVEKAYSAAKHGSVAEAEVLAANVLLAEEDPEARGVLARFGLAARPAAGPMVPMRRPCDSIATARDGTNVYCLGGGTLSKHPTQPGALAPSIPAKADVVRIASHADVGVVVATTSFTKFTPSTLEIGSPRKVRKLEPSRVTLTARGTWLLHSTSGWLLVFDLRAPDKPPRRVRVCRGSHVHAIASTRDESQLAVGCLDGTLAMMATATWTLREMPTYRGIASLAFDNAEQRLAVGNVHGKINIVTIAGKELAALAGNPRAVRRLVWSPDDRLLAAGSANTSVFVWESSSGRLLSRIPARGVSTGLSFSGPNALLTAGEQIRIWQLPNPWATASFRVTAGLSSADLSPDGRWLATAHGDGEVRVWRRSDGTLHHRLPLAKGVVKRAVFSPDGRWLAASSAGDDKIRVFNSGTWAVEADLGNGAAFPRIGFTPSGRHVVGLDYRHVLVAWATGSWTIDSRHNAGRWDNLQSGAGASNLIASDSEGGIWRLTSGGKLVLTRAATVAVDVHAVAASADGQWIATIEDRNVVQLRDAAGKVVRTLRSDSPTLSIAFSPDSSQVVTTHLDGLVIVRRTRDGTRLAVLRAHTDRAVQAKFDATGKVLVTASWDGTARLWDMRALDAAPTELAAAAHKRWAMDLESAIRSPVR